MPNTATAALLAHFEPLTHHAAAGMRTFFRIAAAWGLTPEEERTLLGAPRSTVYKWKSGEVGRVSPDTLERLSHVFGIYHALHTLFADAERADAWIRRPNQAPLFRGGTALERMLRGRVSDLYEMRRYLEGVASGP